MEFIPYYVPANFCCLIISKIKNDITILQQEIERLSVLEEECNKKLDAFYASKQEFEFMLRNLQNKLLNPEVNARLEEKQIIDEFVDYVTSVWQIGADKLVQAQKRLQYISIMDGLPLAMYLHSLQNSIQKSSLSIAQTVCHPYCTSLFYSMYTEITGDLIVRLSTADICFRQYEYLKRALPFLQKLKKFIEMYMDKGTICSVKLFTDEVISCINLKILGDENYDDKENLGAFRNVINLLTGKLLGLDNILDPHSEITPVVCDITYPRPSKTTIVKRLVDYFFKDEYMDTLCFNSNFKLDFSSGNLYPPLTVMDNYQLQDGTVINMSDDNIMLISDDFNGAVCEMQDAYSGIRVCSPSAISVYDPFQNCFQSMQLSQPRRSNSNISIEHGSPSSTKSYESQGRNTSKPNSHKRGPKPSYTGAIGMDVNFDLKPIKIPKLKQDLIKPLNDF